MKLLKAKVSLEDYAQAHLEKAPHGNKFICPYCNSGGNGSFKSDSGFSLKGNSFKCFACNRSGDIYDLAAQVEHIDETEKRAQLKAVANWAGIPLSGLSTNEARRTTPKKTPNYAQGQAKEKAYILEAQKHIEHPQALAYIQSRGYTLEQAQAFGLGYDPAKKRLVIPWLGSDYYHIDRDTTGKAPNKYSKPKSDEVGEQPLYNPQALEGNSFFVVEGLFDALALKALGFNEVVALAGVGVNKLTQALLAKPNKPIAIFMFDKDEPGREAAIKAAEKFNELHLPYITPNLDEIPGKDPDEMRQNDIEALGDFLRGEKDKADKECSERQEQAYKEALRSLRVVSLHDTAEQLLLCEGISEPIPTGFKNLDEALSGGLTRGLYILGAISSLGKTTFILQIADQIAASKHPVLFVTIEQSARELVAKSLSRLTKQLPDGGKYASTANEISNPKSRNVWAQEKTIQLLKACEEYEAIEQGYLHIMEGEKQPSVSDIATLARRIAEHENKAPVIFIDYLQLLKPQSENDTDKQAVDKNIMLLRQLARDLDTAVVAISSLNRASYSGGVTLESFKESGAIEYGSDVLLGLQPYDLREKVKGIISEAKQKAVSKECISKHKEQIIRKLSLPILKNRNGGINEIGVPFIYDTWHNLWSEPTESDKEKTIEDALPIII